MRRALHRALTGLACMVGVGLVTVATGGCLVDVSFEETRFGCSDGRCPDGFTCQDAVCVPAEPPDQGGGDAGPADAAAPPDAATLLACDEQFGAAPGYQLCAEEPTTCEFFNQLDVSTPCTDICATYGASCAASYDAEPAAACTREVDGSGCDVLHQTQICVCTRSAGG